MHRTRLRVQLCPGFVAIQVYRILAPSTADVEALDIGILQPLVIFTKEYTHISLR